MLLGEGERPRASGMQPAAAQATNGLVIDLRHATAQLWASSADAIKAACGPHVPTGLVDEIDVLAWLTADALGRPLLHHDDTNVVAASASLRRRREWRIAAGRGGEHAQGSGQGEGCRG